MDIASLEAGLDAAESAVARDDKYEALCILAELSAQYPAAPAPMLRAIAIMVAAELWDDAVELIAEGRARFPDDEGFAKAQAALAERSGAGAVPEPASNQDAATDANCDAALRILADLGPQFADTVRGYLDGARALREQRRFAEAEIVLTAAMTRFPDASAPVTEHAWLAHIGRDWPEAVRRWEHLRGRYPDVPTGFSSGAVALREVGRQGEAERLLEEAIERFPSDRGTLTEHAWLALIKRDWPEAARRWERVRQRYPGEAEAYLRGAAALAATWRLDEAEKLAEEGIRRFPHNEALANEYAGFAMRENRLDEAARRFAAMRENFPRAASGHIGGALCLRNQFRLREAEKMLERAQELLPGEPRFSFEHAQIPIYAPLRRDRDPDEAIRRVERLIARFPTFEEGYGLGVRYYREAERLDEADALARAGMERFPASVTLALEHGHTARRRGDLDEAARRFTSVRDRFPHHHGGIVGLAGTLSAGGRYDEAEAILRAAMERFPAEKAVVSEFAQIAARQGHWREALERWSEADRRFPDDQEFSQRMFDARMRLAESDMSAVEIAAPAPMAAPIDADDPRAELRDMLMRFESLGGRGLGCEFGIFQREFAAEPLGLLRWADMPYEGIVAVLESRFAGVGLPENTELFINRENSRPEYTTRDRRGFMYQRCFIYEDEIAFERMWKQSLRRLVFLKDKLIADLEAGAKLFVWRQTERNLTESELDRLHRAVRSYGDAMLLYVRYEEEDHPNGTVELAKPGLMVGYIDRFKISPTGQLSARPPTASWLALCRKADALWRQGQDGTEHGP
ncbi:MAG TPA: tetratricopeptide repeat protein [Stellaceae bacterium]|nr:tetratricopeptide repeat protein [Stellaceae bacterium]